MQTTERKISELIPAEYNPRQLSDKQFEDLKASLTRFGAVDPAIVNIHPERKDIIVGGHQRLKVAKSLGWETFPCVEVNLTRDQERELNVRLNKNTGSWDWNILGDLFQAEELKEWGFIDEELFGNIEVEEAEAQEDNYEIPDEIETDIVLGDLIEIGEHRLLCGDSTDSDQVAKLMNGEKADLAHNDPPYGMKKENEGVINDNLNYNDLLEFNKQWIPLQFTHLKENGSWYCWGIDEPLMDIYSDILKPYIKNQKVTFRNLITWNKTHQNTTYRVNGFRSPDLRSYYSSDEKCLFVMCGVQGFNNNSDNYYEGWEPIRKYLCDELEKTGLSAKDLKPYIGDMFGHYFTKSQWSLPTKEKYEALQKASKEKGFKREYDQLKREFYATRAYFDNMHDKMKDTWTFEITSNEEREETGGHATPKPIPLCERVIKSSCPDDGLVIDFFLGSGSTMVASHQLGRKCYGMELDPKYCQVIVDRMLKLDPSLQVKINGE